MKSASSPPYRIGRSKTGLGMFATAPIRKGAFIAEYTGRKLTSEAADKKWRSRYLFDLNKKWTIDGTPRSNVARYINHACRPNAEPFIYGGKIRIRAVKRIEPEQEITYNYGKDYFDLFITKKGCKCAACVAKRRRKRAAARANGAAKKAKANGRAKRK